MKDYSELEGKIIKYVYADGTFKEGKIVGCDYDIGISIVNNEDVNHYLLCVVLPGASNWEEEVKEEAEKAYKVFDKIIEMINTSDSIIMNEILEFKKSLYNHPICELDPDKEFCAFGQ